MLYSLRIEDPREDRYFDFTVEAPGYHQNGQGEVVFGEAFQRWIDQQVHETSVIWGFAQVKASIAHYFPPRVGWKSDNNSGVYSILREWTHRTQKQITIDSRRVGV